jgi:hypothetical protein
MRVISKKVVGMKELAAIFENEDATRLLNYFISYKEVISKTENRNELGDLGDLPADSSIDDSEFIINVLPKPKELVIK